MREGERNYTKKGERISGDLFWYFVFHNVVSVLYFFGFTLALGVYTERGSILGNTWTQTLIYLLSSEFWQLTIFQIFPLSVISSVLGRITAFYSIKGYIRWRDRKEASRRTSKRWSELNRGINRMGLRFLITAMITSFVYSIGMISYLSYVVFDENALLPLMVVYFGLKVVIYLFVRWFVGSKG